MPKLIFCLATENVITDSSTNLISAMNIVSKIQATVFPSVKPVIHLLMYWRKEGPITQSESLALKVRIKYPTKGYLDHPQGTVESEIPAGKRTLRVISKMEGLPLKEVGTMEFVVKQRVTGGWKKVGSFPVDVIKTTP